MLFGILTHMQINLKQQKMRSSNKENIMIGGAFSILRFGVNVRFFTKNKERSS